MKKLVFTLFLVVFSLSGRSQDSLFKFLPQPQSLEIGEDVLQLKSLQIDFFFHHKATVTEKALMRQISHIWKWSKVLRLIEGSKNAVIQAGIIGADKKFAQNFTSEDLDKIGEQGYIIFINTKNIYLGAHSSQGLFYGIQTLDQLLGQCSQMNIPNLKIVDWPALSIRAWQDDISRGPIPTLEHLKSQITKMAHFKMNALTLYTEHVFQLEGHPEIAPPYGLTKKELAELIRFAKNYYVDVIGNFQSFGHFYHTLKLPAYQQLAETPHVLSPAKEETYTFLKEALDEVVPAYESDYFNINCDETFGLGTGPARAMLDSMSIGELYTFHIKKVLSILAPYDKKVMMWGDIALNHSEILAELPKDIIMLPWAYHAAETFEPQILPIKESGFPFIVCPGVSCWGRIWPDIPTAITNIRNFNRDGIKNGAMGMINTTWDDNGFNLFENNWLPLAWGAECSWKLIDDPDALNRQDLFSDAFNLLFFGQNEDASALFSALSSIALNPLLSGGRHELSWDALLPNETRDSPAAVKTLQQEIELLKQDALQVRENISQNKKAFDVFLFSMDWFQFLLHKKSLQIELNLFLQGKGLEKALIEKMISDLKKELLLIRAAYAKHWKMEYRNGYLDHNLSFFDRQLVHYLQLPGQVLITQKGNSFDTTKTVHLQTLFGDREIYYTLDKSDPKKNGLLYKEGITLSKSATITTQSLKEGTWGPATASFPIHVHDGFVREIALKHPFATQYSGKGSISLVDKKEGSSDYGDGNWLGFQENDFVATLKLDQKSEIDTLTISFLQNAHAWIFFPEEIQLEISVDGKAYTKIGKQELDVNQWREGWEKKQISFPIETEIQHIRLSAKNIKKNPDWHPSAGEKSWIFVDEIWVRR